jgi:rod shape-determining protein MreD
MGNRSLKLFHLSTVLLLALAFVFAQSAFTWPRRLLGAQVDLLPALMTFTALRLGVGSILTLAFVGGLSMDALSLNPLGASPLPLCLIGMGLHMKREQILREETFAQCVVGMAASVAVPLGSLLLILTSGAAPMLGAGFLWDLLVLGVGGGVATPLIFKLMNGLERTLTYQLHSIPSFRPDREIRRGRN